MLQNAVEVYAGQHVGRKDNQDAVDEAQKCGEEKDGVFPN